MIVGSLRTVSQLLGVARNVTAVQQKRGFYRMLNAVFNRPDRNRIKEVGAERACAEWLLRCGAHVKWQGTDKWHTDYNTLPRSTSKAFVIDEVNADEAAVMDIGFPYFDGCKHVRKIRFNYCPYLEDTAIVELRRLKDSLEHLEIISCGDISDQGLVSLTQLQLLQTLLIKDLPQIRDKQGCYNALQKGLPKCDIQYKDLDVKNTPAG